MDSPSTITLSQTFLAQIGNFYTVSLRVGVLCTEAVCSLLVTFSDPITNFPIPELCYANDCTTPTWVC